MQTELRIITASLCVNLLAIANKCEIQDVFWVNKITSLLGDLQL